MGFDFRLLHTARQNPLLVRILLRLMEIEELKCFRLVGGTNLALKYDHRYSVDIDLFTDSEYGTVDFTKIEAVLKERFAYVEPSYRGVESFGRTFFVGNSDEECVKLDIMYTDKFLEPFEEYGNIRTATANDIIAMKIEAVNTGARKKDFWDIHLLMNMVSFEEMLSIHKRRHPYTHDRNDLLQKMISFEDVEAEPEPICYQGYEWTDVKLDIIDEVLAIKDKEVT